jgi:LysR family transcriptional regulator, regulator for bpeEF and oprC
MKGLQQFIAFAETAKHGSFAAAARELGGAPSTAAKAVARLEGSLGVKLFHRTTRQVQLTPDGERLFQRCQRVLAEVDELHADAAGIRAEPTGTLRLDLPIVYGREVVLPLLATLVQRHPRLELDVRLSDGFVDLVRDGIDLAVRVGAMRDSTLVARRIDRMVMLLCASPAYLAAHGTPRHIENLAAHTAIVFRQPTSGRTRAWRLRQRGQTVESHPRARVRVNDGEGMIAAARLGLGLAQLPDHLVAGALARGELVEVLPSCRPDSVPINAVYPSGRMVPARVRVLLEALREIARRPRPA